MEDIFAGPGTGPNHNSDKSAAVKGEILDKKQLANGMELVLYDRSRPLVGDRWHVEILCRANIPFDEGYWEMIPEEAPRQGAAIRKMLGDMLVYDSSKKRTFVAAGEKEAALREMMQQIYDSILEYLNRPDFPLRLFQKRYRDARQKVLLNEAIQRARKPDPEE